MMRGLAVALFALCSTSVLAQQFPFEKILVPILITEPAPGAFGSLWTTELVARNESESGVEVINTVGLCGTCPVNGAHTTFSLHAFTPNPNAGVFFYVGSPGIGLVNFSLRVQDISRQSQTWGTSIPVLRERDMRTGTVQLLDVPVDAHFRSALRVYDFDSNNESPPSAVRVRIFNMCGVGDADRNCSNDAIVDSVITLPPGRASGSFAQTPVSAMIGSLVDAFPQLASVQPTVSLRGIVRPATVRVVVDPVTTGLRFWAFVSATNNETQHVTVIAPQ
jgi:hypothetical protein